MTTPTYQTAVQDFKRARRQAAVEQLLARLTGKEIELIPYDMVESQIDTSHRTDHGIREVPLAAIVGSVGRFEDFTRSFLPKRDSNESRWVGVKTAVLNMRGWPPIELYQVGDVYFVLDGNHRVSVARQLGNETITAHVVEIKTAVPLRVGDDPNDFITKAQHAAFLQATKLDVSRPASDLTMSLAGYYTWLLQQIETHRQTLPSAPSLPEAAVSWYDTIYLPTIDMMRQQAVLHYFPNRSETDLYVLLSKHRAELEEELGWQIDAETILANLAEQRTKPGLMSRVGQQLVSAVPSVDLRQGPLPGQWRKRQLESGRQNWLFADYLLPISGSPADWHMLSEMVAIAKRDGDRLLGLHVVPNAATAESTAVQAIQQQFEAMCAAGGVKSAFAVEVGAVVDTIVRRAAWVDLVVTTMTDLPQKDTAASRLSSGFIPLVQQCPRPILAIPPNASCPMNHILLAYDGSPKADEALFVATYLAGRWADTFTVLTVETEYTPPETLQKAEAYIASKDMAATYLLKQKPIADAVLQTAVAVNANMLVMGGFGYQPLLHRVLGSTVERVLAEVNQPVLICR